MTLTVGSKVFRRDYYIHIGGAVFYELNLIRGHWLEVTQVASGFVALKVVRGPNRELIRRSFSFAEELVVDPFFDVPKYTLVGVLIIDLKENPIPSSVNDWWRCSLQLLFSLTDGSGPETMVIEHVEFSREKNSPLTQPRVVTYSRYKIQEEIGDVFGREAAAGCNYLVMHAFFEHLKR